MRSEERVKIIWKFRLGINLVSYFHVYPVIPAETNGDTQVSKILAKTG